MLVLFYKGMIIGLIIAMPFGPIGALCVQRSLNSGFKTGLMTGLGAALADGTYGIIAGFGLTALSSWILAGQYWLSLIGGLFLLYYGVNQCLHFKRNYPLGYTHQTPLQAFTGAYFLALTNPATLLVFLALFAGLGLADLSFGPVQAMVLVIAIITGSSMLWLLLSGSVALIFKNNLAPQIMGRINLTAGIIILIFGILIIASTLSGYY